MVILRSSKSQRPMSEEGHLRLSCVDDMSVIAPIAPKEV